MIASASPLTIDYIQPTPKESKTSNLNTLVAFFKRAESDKGGNSNSSKALYAMLMITVLLSGTTKTFDRRVQKIQSIVQGFFPRILALSLNSVKVQRAILHSFGVQRAIINGACDVTKTIISAAITMLTEEDRDSFRYLN